VEDHCQAGGFGEVAKGVSDLLSEIRRFSGLRCNNKVIGICRWYLAMWALCGIESGTIGNAIEPVSKRFFLSQSRKPDKCLHEGILCRITSLLEVPKSVKCDPIDGVSVANDQFTEGRLVSRSRCYHKFAVTPSICHLSVLWLIVDAERRKVTYSFTAKTHRMQRRTANWFRFS
jgi:hypothetical protein